MSRRRRDVINASEYRQFQTEAQLQHAIESQAHNLGFKHYHTRIPQGSNKGFPDLVICGHGIVLYVECKGPTGSTTKDQEAWIAELQKANQFAMVASTEEPDHYELVVKILQDAYTADFFTSRT
jgi:hypothetical protein